MINGQPRNQKLITLSQFVDKNKQPAEQQVASDDDDDDDADDNAELYEEDEEEERKSQTGETAIQQAFKKKQKAEQRRIVNQANNKETRNIYLEKVRKFIASLTSVSLKLKQIPNKDERKQKLTEYLQKSNSFIRDNRLEQPHLDYFHGIVLPFCRSYCGLDRTVHSDLVVRVHENDFICFETRQRVPYRIIVETIDLEDLNKGYKLPQYKRDTDLDESQAQTAAETGVESNKLNGKGTLSKQSSFSKLDPFDTISLLSSSENLEKIKLQKTNKYGNGLEKFVQKQQKEEQEKLQQQNVLSINFFDKFFKGNEQQQQNQSGGRQRNTVSSVASNGRTSAGARLKSSPDRFKRQSNSVARDFLLARQKSLKRKLDELVTITDPLRMAKYEKNLNIFQILWPKPEARELTLKRSASCQEIYSKLIRLRKAHFEYAELQKRVRRNSGLVILTPVQKLGFFRSTMTTLQNEQKIRQVNKLRQIFEKLGLDICERNLQNSKALCADAKNLNEQSFARFLEPWGEIWDEKREILRRNSPYGHFPSFECRSIIVKGGDDLRQELVAMQIIYKFRDIFQAAGLPIWVRPYEIVVTSASSGLIEFLPNTLSVDGLKKKVKNFKSLASFYKEVFKGEFEEAQRNFITSLAGYSLVCYLLQIKDRHNGNILIDHEGHVIHIDYGFILTSSPGNFKFEQAPFKLTSEYVELLGGKMSETFRYFKHLLVLGFKELRKHVNDICSILSVMMEKSDLLCFEQFDMAVFRNRFQETFTDEQFAEYVEQLVYESLDNWRTTKYDQFQKITNNIIP